MSQVETIRAGVFDSPYSSLSEQLFDHFEQNYSYLPLVLVSITFEFYKWRTGVDVSEINAIKAIEKIEQRPLLLMHCDNDPEILVKHSKKLFKAANQPKDQWLAPCDVHGELWQHHPQKSEERVVTFFKNNL